MLCHFCILHLLLEFCSMLCPGTRSFSPWFSLCQFFGLQDALACSENQPLKVVQFLERTYGEKSDKKIQKEQVPGFCICAPRTWIRVWPLGSILENVSKRDDLVLIGISGGIANPLSSPLCLFTTVPLMSLILVFHRFTHWRFCEIEVTSQSTGGSQESTDGDQDQEVRKEQMTSSTRTRIQKRRPRQITTPTIVRNTAPVHKSAQGDRKCIVTLCILNT